ncbi:hypothetical protein A9R05_23085 [Burkholderia sp. KK1]|nr:hypothetical protein A9R05_23085 [Burkholderia sp. KK1]
MVAPVAYQGAPEDQVFFNERGVQVTNARFIIPGNRTFAMSGVTAVRMTVTRPSKMAPGMLIVAGVVIAASMFAGDGPVAMKSLMFPAIVVALGVLWISQIKPTFYVVLSTASGETQALKDRSADWISRIVDALNRCIVYRG